ncbi:MAG TPA: hypothetical protein VK590_05675 [Saprospiraceae bacterium]|nr:hypothetical protein [Saprospiraceae bacterium]
MSISTNNIIRWILRIFILVLLQVLILKKVHLPWDKNQFGQIFLYPIIIIFLPAATSRPFILCLAFLIGITVDIFYNSPGVHTGSLVLMAYLKPYTFSLLEPRLGIKIGQESAGYSFGFAWLFVYTSILIFAFCLTYFVLEIFTAFYIVDIILMSFYIVIFNPKI